MPKKVVSLKKSPKRGSKKGPKNVMKNMEKLSSKNVDSFSASRSATLTGKLFSSIIIILFIYGIIVYLKDLQKCECLANKQQNIKTLLYIEYLFIALNIIGLIGTIMAMMMPKQTGGSTIIYMLMLYMFCFIFIYGLLVYNAFKVFEGINDNCECSISSLRYLLYIQTFIAIIYLLIMFFGVIALMKSI